MPLTRSLVLGCLMAIAVLSSSCQTQLAQIAHFDSPDEALPEYPAAKAPTVRMVAADIDRLEKHLDKYGSIVPKHADVWGQARLMMYRWEFERAMRPDAYTFRPTLQAAISTSDQAYLASAFSLEAALGGAKPVSGTDLASLVSKPDDVIKRTELFKGINLNHFVGPDGRLALEPTIIEDQKKRFLDHLAELRRINEGDDNADAPGYALNLIRIPISILSGDCTQVGCGAECTITATPHLPDDLLPQTFKNLVINDLVKLLTLPVTRIIETTEEQDLASLLKTFDDLQNHKKMQSRLKNIDDEIKRLQVLPIRSAPQRAETSSRILQLTQQKQELNKDIEYIKNIYSLTDNASRDVLAGRTSEAIYKKIAEGLSYNTPTSIHRADQVPIPGSQLLTTFGAHNLAWLAQHVRKPIQQHLACKNHPYHLDVAAILRSELNASYELLSSPPAQTLWEDCTPTLAQAIRIQDAKTVIAIQEDFFHNRLESLSATTFTTTKDGDRLIP